MRTTTKLRLALAAVLLLVSSSASAEMMSVRVIEANCRAAPSLEAQVLFTVDRYFPVKVLERRGDWVKVVDFENEQAWIAYHLLSKRETVIVRIDGANLREGPGLNHDVARSLSYGEVFWVAERKGRWLQIARGRKVVGWVRDDITWGD